MYLGGLALSKASFLDNGAVACCCMRMRSQPGTCHNVNAGLLYQGQLSSQQNFGMLLHAIALATWHMSKCHRRHSFGNCNILSRHSYASSYMRLLLQPGTRDNAYAGLLLTRQAFVTAELVHVVACICFDNRAHDMVPALASYRQGIFFFHSTSAPCACFATWYMS